MTANKITSDSPDYEKLKNLLGEVDPASAEFVGLTDEITKLDVIDILDGADDKFNIEDFHAPAFKRNVRLFGEIDSLLDKSANGWMSVYYNLPVEDRQRASRAFVKSGSAAIPKALAYDANFLVEALGIDGRCARWVPREMFEKHGWLARQALYSNPSALEFIPRDILINNPEICEIAVEDDGMTLEFVPTEVQIAQPELVHLALMQTPEAFAHVAADFQIAYPEVTTALLGILGEEAFVDIAPEFWTEHAELMAMDWEGLRGAPLDTSDPESLFAWLTADGMNLAHVPEEIQATSPEIVLAALLQNPEALKFSATAFQRENQEIVAAVLKCTDNPSLYYFSEEYQETADVEELKDLLQRDPMGLAHLTPRLALLSPSNYLACVTTAVEWDGRALGCVSSSYRNAHPELILAAVNSKALALEFTDSAWQIAHPGAVLSAIDDDAEALAFLTPKFQTYHPKTTLKAVTQAVERDPFTIGYMPAGFQLANVEIVYQAVDKAGDKSKFKEGDSILYCLSDEFLLAHPDIVERTIDGDNRNMGTVVAAINDHVAGISGEHPGLISAIMAESGDTQDDIADWVAERFWGNMGVIESLLQLDAGISDKAWNSVRWRAQEMGLDFTVSPETGECNAINDPLATPKRFKAFLYRHTQFPEHFHSLKAVHEIFINGENKKDTRPVALLLMTKNDYNGAFESSAVTEGLVNDGRFRVVCREIESDGEITQALKENGPVHTLILAGHGSKTKLKLGPDGSDNDEDHVDTDDFDNCDEKAQSYFVPGGNILLWACSNGAGGEEDDNLHRAFSWSYPGVSVTSAPESVNIEELSFDANLRLHTKLFDSVNPVQTAPRI